MIPNPQRPDSIIKLQIRQARMAIIPDIVPESPVIVLQQENQQYTNIRIAPIKQSSTGKCLVYAPVSEKTFPFRINDERFQQKLTMKIVSGGMVHCQRKISVKEILEVAKIGKIYYLGLEGANREKIHYSDLDLSVETFHSVVEFPYQIQFSVILPTQHNLNFEVQRIANIESCKIKNYIPNFYSIPFSLSEFNFQTTQKYRQILKGSKNKGLVIDFDMRDIIRQFQIEQSKSESSSGIISSLYDSNTKQNKMRKAQRGFNKLERLQTYMKILNVHSEFQQLVKQYPALEQKSLQTVKVSSKDLRNFLQDYDSLGYRNPNLFKVMILYLQARASIKFKNSRLLYSKGVLYIASRLLGLVDYACRQNQLKRHIPERLDKSENQKNPSQPEQNHKIQKTFKILLAFVLKVTPYFKDQATALCSDLITCRILTKKLLRQFGFKLNQQHISSDNLIATKLLQLFSRQHPELTFRIWDFLVYVSGEKLKVNVLPMVAFTYLTFLEVNNLTEFFPINKFMIALVENINRIDPCEHTRKHLECQIFQSLLFNINKDRLIEKMAQAKYLTRFLDPRPTIRIPQQDTVSFRSTHGIGSPNVQTNSKHMEFSVKYLHLLFKKVQINCNNEFELLQGNGSENSEFQVNFQFNDQPDINRQCLYKGVKKISYLNKYLKNKVTRNQSLSCTIEIMYRRNRSVHIFSFSKNGYPYDVAHKINVRLPPLLKRSTNQCPQNSIEIIFVLETNRENAIVPADFHYESIVPLKLRDYDMSPTNNQFLKASVEFQQYFERIKFPLDEFGQPYKSLQVNALKSGEVAWVKNLNISMEKLKGIFKEVFYEQEDRSFRQQWSTLFEAFSYKKQCQYFEFARFLISLTLKCRLSRYDKVSCLYSILGTYDHQNGKEGISCQSLHRLFQEIYIRYLYVPFNPYSITDQGSIVEGWLYFTKGPNVSSSRSRVQCEKADITGLLKTWTFIQELVYKTRDVIMGDNGDEVGLMVLKSLFDHTVHQKIITNGGCSIEILYRSGGAKWLWVCELDQKFKIRKRGSKRFGQYPPYIPIQEPCSEAQVLYHCQNILPLTNWTPVSVGRFSEMIQNDALINYLLCSEVDVYVGIDEQTSIVSMTTEVYVDNKLKSKHSINKLDGPGSLLGVSISSSISNIRNQLQTISSINLQTSRYLFCKVNNTKIYEHDIITFKNLIDMAAGITPEDRQSPKIIEFHYSDSRKIEKKKTYNCYAIYRYSGGIEDWIPCHIEEKQDKHFIVSFLELSQGHIQDQIHKENYKVPNYEIRGPGFIPIEEIQDQLF